MERCIVRASEPRASGSGNSNRLSRGERFVPKNRDFEAGLSDAPIPNLLISWLTAPNVFSNGKKARKAFKNIGANALTFFWVVRYPLSPICDRSTSKFAPRAGGEKIEPRP